jgi:hypothetical protein
MFDHDNFSLARLDSRQCVGLEKHKQMIRDVLRWQEVSRFTDKPLTLLKWRTFLMAILNVFAR